MVLSPQSLYGSFLFFIQYRGYKIADFITRRSIHIESSRITKIEKLEVWPYVFKLTYKTSSDELALYFFNIKTFNTTDIVISEDVSLSRLLSYLIGH